MASSRGISKPRLKILVRNNGLFCINLDSFIIHFESDYGILRGAKFLLIRCKNRSSSVLTMRSSGIPFSEMSVRIASAISDAMSVLSLMR